MKEAVEKSGTDRTIASCNAGVVKNYKTTVRIFFSAFIILWSITTLVL
jgi:hypothetical protein